MTETAPARPQRPSKEEAWREFAATIALAGDLDVCQVSASSKLVEDLNLDSLALFEVVVALLVDYELRELPQTLRDGDWSGVTVGIMFDLIYDRESPGWQLRWSE